MKRRIYVLDPNMIVAMLTTSQSRNDYISTYWFDDVPEDAVVVGVYEDPARRSICVILEHDSFDNVEPGMLAPVDVGGLSQRSVAIVSAGMQKTIDDMQKTIDDMRPVVGYVLDCSEHFDECGESPDMTLEQLTAKKWQLVRRLNKMPRGLDARTLLAEQIRRIDVEIENTKAGQASQRFTFSEIAKGMGRDDLIEKMKPKETT